MSKQTPDITHHPLYRDGIIHFNAGRYFDAHESLELLWLVTRGSNRDFLAGLILLAAALHQLKVRNYPGAALRLFARTRRRWAPLPPTMNGIHLREIEAQCRRCIEDRPFLPRIDTPDTGLAPFPSA